MKQFIIAAVGLLTMASCGTKKTGSFTVAGTIQNAPSKKVYLMEIPYGEPNPIIIDSVTLDAKGSFSLKGGSKEEKVVVDRAGAGGDVKIDVVEVYIPGAMRSRGRMEEAAVSTAV